MTSPQEAKQIAWRWIEDHRPWLSDLQQQIWQLAEPAYREHRSAQLYVELLREHGFTVEEGSGEMPTAFVATWGSGAPTLTRPRSNR